MLVYCLKRVLRSLLSLAIIIIVVFCLLRLMPIEGYFSNYDQLTAQEIHNALAKMGLTDPLYIQLLHFFQQLLHGSLGISNKYRVDVPVLTIIAKKAPVSIGFGLIAMAISLPLGLALGVVMARKQNGVWDQLGTAYIVFIEAVPIMLIYLFIQLYGTSVLNMGILYDPDNPATAVLPIISLALPSIAGYAMWLRRFMVDESNMDYIKFAKAKGVPGNVIWFTHVFRNAIVPITQLIPESLLLTIGGSIYVESLYSIPGMGGLLVDVIKRQDNTMVQGLVIIFAALSIFGLLLGDLLMALVDPRISLTKKAVSR